jgi:hypothetical protein
MQQLNCFEHESVPPQRKADTDGATRALIPEVTAMQGKKMAVGVPVTCQSPSS